MTRRRRPALNIFGLTLALVLGVSLLTGLGKATTEAVAKRASTETAKW